jgi:hypothetical protein
VRASVALLISHTIISHTMSLSGLEPDETAFDVFNRSKRIVVKTGLPLLEPVSI